jgi:lantibiotic modifying enzyme
VSIIPPQYLSKKGRPWRQLKLQDVVTLIHNVKVGASHKGVGFEDALETYQSLMKKLEHKVLVDPSVLESALWSCNLLNEHGEFWDCKGESFDDFTKRILGKDGFNKFFNVIEPHGE